MKKGFCKGLSLFVVLMMIISMVPFSVIAEETGTVTETAVNSSIDIEKTDSAKEGVVNNQQGISINSPQDADISGNAPVTPVAPVAPEKIAINSLDEIPILSQDENIEQQVVVIYKNSNDVNISSLSMTTNEVKAGEHVSDRVDVLELNDDISSDDVINSMSQNSNVLSVGKNEKIEITNIPNDPYIVNNDAWQFKNVGADKTWDQVSNKTPVVVAVLDTGVYAGHQDLQGRIVKGHDYYTGSTSTTDLAGHGTMVSGCIAAIANNKIGISGIAGSSNIKIAPYRVGGMDAQDRYLYSDKICAALLDIADNRPDIKVINMSFGSYSFDTNINSAVQEAANAEKIIVASSGNEGDKEDAGRYSYPASYDNVISVGATTSYNNLAYFSQYNDRVDLCAPGYYVYTTTNNGSYTFVSGTSFSSPITAASCAVLLAADASLSSTKVENILEDTALDLGRTGKDDYYGNGLVQIDKAVDYVKSGDKLKVGSFTADKVSGQKIGTSIGLSAAGVNGKTPYKYKFSYTLGTTTVTIKDYSATATVNFKPTTAGTYTLNVDVKDADGKTATGSIANYSIVGNPTNPTVISFITDKASGQGVNTSIQLIAAGSGGTTPYQYKFYYKSGSKTTTIQNFSGANTATFKPIAAGTYTLWVDLKDAAGKTSSKSISNYTVVKSLTVKSFTADKASGQGTGTSIRLTAAASDGKTPYQYKFYYKRGTATVTIRDFTTGNTATFTPTTVGIYTLYVDVKDGSGNTATRSIDNYSIVGTPRVTSFTTDKASGQGINTTIKLNAIASDGKTPYQYKFYYKQGTKTTSIRNFSGSSTVTFKPAKAGTYTLWVDVKDASGKIGTASIANYIIYGTPSVKTFTADKASGQYINTGINLTALGSDGKTPYQYKFYYKLGTATTTIHDYAAANTATFKPTAAGIYTLCVDVKDANGIISTKSIAKYSIINLPGVKSFKTDKV